MSTTDNDMDTEEYPRWARHLNPAIRRCSNCSGRGDIGSWHAPLKCGVCKGEGYVPHDSEFAMGMHLDPPTPDELNAAADRLAPFLAGYPEPMIDARRLRISNGTASVQDRREIQAEDQVIALIKKAGADRV